MVKTTISIAHFKRCVSKPDADIVYAKEDVYVVEKGSVEYGEYTVSFVLKNDGKAGYGNGKNC